MRLHKQPFSLGVTCRVVKQELVGGGRHKWHWLGPSGRTKEKESQKESNMQDGNLDISTVDPTASRSKGPESFASFAVQVNKTIQYYNPQETDCKAKAWML